MLSLCHRPIHILGQCHPWSPSLTAAFPSLPSNGRQKYTFSLSISLLGYMLHVKNLTRFFTHQHICFMMGFSALFKCELRLLHHLPCSLPLFLIRSAGTLFPCKTGQEGSVFLGEELGASKSRMSSTRVH